MVDLIDEIEKNLFKWDQLNKPDLLLLANSLNMIAKQVYLDHVSNSINFIGNVCYIQ